MKSRQIAKVSWGCALLALFALVATDGQVVGTSNDVAAMPLRSSTKTEEQILLSHAHILSELSSVRRTSTLFQNEQSVQNGAPVRYVNSFRGNLTFIRRDLVTVGRLPIVLARVYDSSRDSGNDFGPGWHLSLAETIVRNGDGTLSYLDDSASMLTFVPNGGGTYTLSPSAPSDIASVEALGESIGLVYRNGWRKAFARIGDRFQLISVRDAYGNSLELHYGGAKLVRIEAQNGRAISLTRDPLGRVIAATDDQGRAVSYEYDTRGLLITAVDLGGNRWRYIYDARSRLQRAVDPRNVEMLAATYDSGGRVRESRVFGVPSRHEYQGAQTRITDAAEQVTLISHARSGIASSLTNPENFVSAVRFDSQQRIAALLHNNRTRAAFSYGPAARLTRLQPSDATGAGDALEANGGSAHTDDASQPPAALADAITDHPHRGSQAPETYDYAPLGDIRSVTRNGKTVLFTYNADGQIESAEGPGGAIQLAYSADGKLESARYADGSIHRYRYNASGFRERVDRSDGASTAFEYDASGNLVRVEHHTADGTSVVQTLDIDEHNRLRGQVLADGTHVSFKYDAIGNPASITYQGQKPQTFDYRYDRNNRLVAVQQDNAIIGRHDYEATEPDLRVQVDHHTSRVGANVVRQSTSLSDQRSVIYARPYGSYLGTVRYDEATRTLDVPADSSPEGNDSVAANSIMRRELLPLVSGARDEVVAFDHPSNAFFMPPEHNTINCLPNCQLTAVNVTGNGASGSISVPAGTTVNFIATRLPGGNKCTNMQYTWTSNGAFLATGLSAQFAYSFGSPGTYQVVADGECLGCDVSAWGIIVVTVTAPVCGAGASLATHTVATIPANTARTKLGVGEQVNLTLSPAPPCQVSWSVSGGGTLSNVTNSSARFNAHDRASTPTVTATFGSTSRSVPFNVVEPSNLVMQQVAGTGIFHRQGYASVGFIGEPHVIPEDVSFDFIEVREGFAVGVGTGILSVKNGETHPNGPWLDVVQGSTLHPSEVSATDTITTGLYPPPFNSGGTFTWPLPWLFRVPAVTGIEKQFTTLTHSEQVSASGTATISKGGVTRSRLVSDPDSNP